MVASGARGAALFRGNDRAAAEPSLPHLLDSILPPFRTFSNFSSFEISESFDRIPDVGFLALHELVERALPGLEQIEDFAEVREGSQPLDLPDAARQLISRRRILLTARALVEPDEYHLEKLRRKVSGCFPSDDFEESDVFRFQFPVELAGVRDEASRAESGTPELDAFAVVQGLGAPRAWALTLVSHLLEDPAHVLAGDGGSKGNGNRSRNRRSGHRNKVARRPSPVHRIPDPCRLSDDIGRPLVLVIGIEDGHDSRSAPVLSMKELHRYLFRRLRTSLPGSPWRRWESGRAWGRSCSARKAPLRGR